jgi:hypothetical protein
MAVGIEVRSAEARRWLMRVADRRCAAARPLWAETTEFRNSDKNPHPARPEFRIWDIY